MPNTLFAAICSPCPLPPSTMPRSAPIAMRTRPQIVLWVRGSEAPSPEPKDMIPFVVLSKRGEERLHSGHPWIYRADVADARAAGGDVVLVRGPRGRPLGRALFSDRSQISLRLLTYGAAETEVDVAALLRSRIEAAIAFRQ